MEVFCCFLTVNHLKIPSLRLLKDAFIAVLSMEESSASPLRPAASLQRPPRVLPGSLKLSGLALLLGCVYLWTWTDFRVAAHSQHASDFFPPNIDLTLQAHHTLVVTHGLRQGSGWSTVEHACCMHGEPRLRGTHRADCPI